MRRDSKDSEKKEKKKRLEVIISGCCSGMQKSVTKGVETIRENKPRKLNLFHCCEVRIREGMTGRSCYGNCGKEMLWEWQDRDGQMWG